MDGGEVVGMEITSYRSKYNTLIFVSKVDLRLMVEIYSKTFAYNVVDSLNGGRCLI